MLAERASTTITAESVLLAHDMMREGASGGRGHERKFVVCGQNIFTPFVEGALPRSMVYCV